MFELLAMHHLALSRMHAHAPDRAIDLSNADLLIHCMNRVNQLLACACHSALEQILIATHGGSNKQPPDDRTRRMDHLNFANKIISAKLPAAVTAPAEQFAHWAFGLVNVVVEVIHHRPTMVMACTFLCGERRHAQQQFHSIFTAY